LALLLKSAKKTVIILPGPVMKDIAHKVSIPYLWDILTALDFTD
jgi:hypothetical protein